MGKFGKSYHKKKSKEIYKKDKKISKEYKFSNEKVTFTKFKKKKTLSD